MWHNCNWICNDITEKKVAESSKRLLRCVWKLRGEYRCSSKNCCKIHVPYTDRPKNISQPITILFTITRQKLTVLKAQHDPHCPWSLTGVTYPFSLQSTWSGRDLRLEGERYAEPLVDAEAGLRYPFIFSLTSEISYKLNRRACAPCNYLHLLINWLPVM